MATNIFNYDGTLLTTVEDGSIDTSSASIKFPGRGFVNYGGPVNENMLWIMQNFASNSAPTHPLTGQAWYDTSSQILKVYNGSTWITTGSVILSGTPPVSGGNQGALWFDTTNKQLYVWNSSAWLLVGPLGSSINTDPINPVVPAYSQWDSSRISDGSLNHQVWRLTIGGTLFAIFSKDAQFTPSPSITGFSVINPGINLNSTISGVGLSGDSTLFRNNQSNLPNADNTYNMGSGSFRFANMYAVNFNGIASSARYADLAEKYKSDVPLSPGTVVSLGGDEEVTISMLQGDTNVFGVVSTDPGYLMNADAGDDFYPIALVGRIPCKVVGPVAKHGRLMTSSLPGVAIAWEESAGTLAIIGRALVSKSNTGVELIEIVVGKN